MKDWLRGVGLALLLSTMLLTVSGCGFTLSPQELYSLPKLPPEYTELNNLLNAILAGGAENAPPTSGNYTQPVQMRDLDGDGQKEAIAFFRDPNDEKPLKIYIFTAKDQTYEQTALIEGSGTGIYSIDYRDLDQDGRTELLVGWRVSADIQALSVYSLRRGEPEELMGNNVNYVKYAVTDLDQDQLQELVVLRADEEGSGVADYYDWQDGGLVSKVSVRISMTMAELSQQGRVTKGTLSGGVPALFVTGVDDTSKTITDILAVRNGELANVVLSDITGVSTEIASFRNLYPTDINGDGVTEVPRPVDLPARGNGEDNLYQRIDWCGFDIQGTAVRAVSTYHSVEDGWYLQLPENWEDKILVSRSVGADETVVTFSIWGADGGPSQEFLKIYTLTGSNREIRAGRGNRFILRRQQAAIYVAELLEANDVWEDGVTGDDIQASFNLIAREWNPGDN